MTPIDSTPHQQNVAHDMLRSDLFSQRPLTRQRKTRPTSVRSRDTHHNKDILIQDNNLTEETHRNNNTESLMDRLMNTTVADNITTITNETKIPSGCNHTPSYRFESRLQHGARQTWLSISFDFLEDVRGRIGKIIGSDYSGNGDDRLGLSHDIDGGRYNEDFHQGDNNMKAKHQLAHLFQQKTMNSWIDRNPRLFGMTVI